MFDVAFTVEGPWELPENVPAIVLLGGLQQRITNLMLAHIAKEESITEAFGFCDSCEVTEDNNMSNR